MIRLLARSFNTRRSQVRLISGEKSKIKIVEIEGLSEQDLRSRLEQLTGSDKSEDR